MLGEKNALKVSSLSWVGGWDNSAPSAENLSTSPRVCDYTAGGIVVQSK